MPYPKSKWSRYFIAIATVVLATLIRHLLDPIMGDRRPMTTYLFAVMFVAWYCGSGPTVLAVFLSMGAAAYYFLVPRHSPMASNPADQVSLLIFMTIGLFMALLTEQLYRAMERGEWRQLQRKSELALIESEHRFRQLADAMPQIVWTVGPDGMADYYNERWYAYTGLAPDAQGDESWKPAYHPEDIAPTQAAWKQSFESGELFEVEYRLKDCRTGDYRWHLGRAVPTRDDTGKIVQWFGTSTDIDERKKVEEKLQKAHDELEKRVQERTYELTEVNQSLSHEIEERRVIEDRMRRLAFQLASAEDTERRRFATDLHDSISQSLSLLKLNLEPLAERGLTEPAQQQSFTNSLQLLNDIIKQTRTLMFELYPAMLHDLGLVPTLHWYSEKLSPNAQVAVSEMGKPQQLPAPQASYIFRAVKELIGNALRHGRAREVLVAVHWRDDLLKIVVDDDGSGFDPVQVLVPRTQRGLGLAGISERLVSFKGKLLTESEVGLGARIIMELPLDGNLASAPPLGAATLPVTSVPPEQASGWGLAPHLLGGENDQSTAQI